MSLITVYQPAGFHKPAQPANRAQRVALPAAATLTLIDNGKVHARLLLQLIADRLRTRLPIDHVEVFTKASAGLPIGAEEARRVAARSHLIVTGVGD